MTIKEYLTPLAKKDKKLCRMFVQYLIKWDVYVRFINNLSLFRDKEWSRFYSTRPVKEWEYYLIFDAFRWHEPIWGGLNDEWRDIVRKHYSQ